MSYASQQQGLTGTKLVALIIALAIVGGIGAVMVIGLAINAIKKEIERVTTVDIEEPPPPEEPDEPPPPQENTAPPPPVAPPPPISIAPAAARNGSGNDARTRSHTSRCGITGISHSNIRWNANKAHATV